MKALFNFFRQFTSESRSWITSSTIMKLMRKIPRGHHESLLYLAGAQQNGTTKSRPAGFVLVRGEETDFRF